ncbi:inositol monophosphatase family protein [Lentzea guizhouensis]|uniref:inositol monophosphatase family protein n=1 Tax=Lentzea guizhouensis TaxID=1586287 RepID=UPI000AB25820
MLDPRPLVDIAAAIGREAGALVQRMRASAVVSFDTKSTSTDVVTEADRASEQLVRTRLSESRPGEPVLGEEEGGTVVEGLTWVVDPIDGTVNYLYGIPWYSVSIAAQLNGESVAGAVFEPATGRMWTAARGHGAFLDGTPLRVSATTDLSLSLLGYGFAYRAERRQRQADTWAAMSTRVRDLRRAGAASWTCARWPPVASTPTPSTAWAAGTGRGGLIAAEAGAVVRLPGTSPELGEDATFAAAPGVADEMYAALAESGFGKV